MPSKKLVTTILNDRKAPIELRVQVLKDLVRSDASQADPYLKGLLEAAANGSGEDQYVAKAQELEERLKQLDAGPFRCASYVRTADLGALGKRAEVVLADGTSAFSAVVDPELLPTMRCGDTVWLDARAQAVLYAQPDGVDVGDVARLERILPSGDVEVTLAELGRSVYRSAARLSDQFAQGEAAPGSSLLVCPRRRLAFRALPPENGMSHFRYLRREPIPDVRVERDLGAPLPCFAEIVDHLRREMTHAGLGSRYRLRRSQFWLFSGAAGTGKTFLIRALWRRMYELMSEVTGVAMDALPPRVLSLRASDVLSKWFGESDRNVARFFDEAEQLAREPFFAPDGRRHELPVLVIAEEIDALARQRGHDGLHDRVLSTLLQRMDPSEPSFRDKLILSICTTNAPQLVDVAVVRRAGGRVQRFGRPDRRAFQAVLTKQVQGLPFQALHDPDSCAEVRTRDAVARLTAWLFAPEAEDPGLVEILFHGRANPVVKRRKHFLTPALVDRAVQQAGGEACAEEYREGRDGGLTLASLARAIDAQLRSLVSQLNAENAAEYVDLPDGVRVASIRRLDLPELVPFELERPC